MSNPTQLTVDELLLAMARALVSDDGLTDFHRLAAEHEASVHHNLRHDAGQDAAD